MVRGSRFTIAIPTVFIRTWTISFAICLCLTNRVPFFSLSLSLFFHSCSLLVLEAIYEIGRRPSAHFTKSIIPVSSFASLSYIASCIPWLISYVVSRSIHPIFDTFVIARVSGCYIRLPRILVTQSIDIPSHLALYNRKQIVLLLTMWRGVKFSFAWAQPQRSPSFEWAGPFSPVLDISTTERDRRPYPRFGWDPDLDMQI